MGRLISVVIVFSLISPAVAQKTMQQPPENGTVFRFDPKTPKFVTGDIEFRDPREESWPTFFFGRPSESSTFTFDAAKPSIKLSYLLDTQPQRNGDQDRRTLADLLTPGQSLPVTLSIENAGPWATKSVDRERKGKKVVETETYFPVHLTLMLGTWKATLNGEVQARWSYAKNATKPDTVQLTLHASTTGKELGLKDAARPIEINFHAIGYLDPAKARK